MKKSDRQIVFDKCGGRCAYCGCELVKTWQVDHIEPVRRIQKRKEGYHRNKVTKVKINQNDLPQDWWKEYEYVNPKLVFDKMQHPERDNIENSMPSCHSCNITKAALSVEGFRGYIERTVESLNKNHYAAYKFAKRYELIQETPKPVIFYFETLKS